MFLFTDIGAETSRDIQSTTTKPLPLHLVSVNVSPTTTFTPLNQPIVGANDLKSS